MTPEQQRIAIAEACGWTDVRFIGRGDDTMCVGKPKVRPGGINVPDYPFDLNAMHEVEEHAIHNLMDADEWMEYGMLLKQSHPHGLFLNGEIDYHDLATVCHATAAQRAEAFLRTIGKWEEAK